MKKLIFIIVCFLATIKVSGQFVHVNNFINNKDKKTRDKLNSLISTLTQNNAALAYTNNNLKTTLQKHEGQLNKNYSRNKFDKEDNFLTSSLSSISLSVATSILGTYKNMPYISESKKEYLNDITMDKSILLALQYIDSKKVKASKRQEIYRLRSELIRELSKNNREARQLLMLPLLAQGLISYEEFIALKNKLDAVEIIF
jgi:hypothetical protein